MEKIDNLTHDELVWVLACGELLRERGIKPSDLEVGILYGYLLEGKTVHEAVTLVFGRGTLS